MTLVLWEESLTVWSSAWRMKGKLVTVDNTIAFVLQRTHSRLSSRTLSSSVLCILHHWVIRAQGWWMGVERSSFCASSQACVCHRRAPWRPSIWSHCRRRRRRLSNPHPITGRRFRLKEKQEARKEKKQDRKSEEEMENKLFTLTANAPQRVVKRKHAARAGPAASASRRDVWAPGRGASARGGWANPQGRRQTIPIPSSSSCFDLIYVTTLKTLGRNKITEDHFASKSGADYFLLRLERQRSI